MSTVVQCPHCQARMRVARRSFSGRYRCVKCRQVFQDGAVAAQAVQGRRAPTRSDAVPGAVQPAAAPAVAAAPMSTVRCPHCQIEVTLPPGMAIHEAACPECRRPLAHSSAQTPGADSASAPARLPELASLGVPVLNIGWLLALGFLTSGVYWAVWFLHNYPALARVPSRVKMARWLILASILLLLAPGIAGWLLGVAAQVHEYNPQLEPVVAGLFLAWVVTGILCGTVATILWIILAFQARAIIADHYQARFGHAVELSGFLTFLLGCLYLQYKINELEWRLARRAT